jgi:RNA polymerase sigma factor (sigma-70 family)
MPTPPLIDLLIAHDEQATQQFFFQDCRPLFMSIAHTIFEEQVDYDEMISELYLHLMEDDARRLRQFQGRSSIYQWIKTVAIRFFLEKRDEMIEKDSEEHLLEQAATSETIDTEPRWSAKMDVEHLFARMPNQRYVHVIRRLVLEEASPKTVADELGITIDNLYNIKKRAMAALTAVALNETKAYEKSIR